MAYPTVDKPYGLQPINLIGGQVFAGSTRQLKIASGYPANIFAGDVVKLVSTGVIEKDTGTITATPVGVFVGCQFTNPSTKQIQFQQYWPTGTVAADAVAFVLDDPDVLFKVAAVSSGTTIAFYGQTVIGTNVALVQNSGSTTTGDSAVAIDGSSAATTASLPIRIVAGVPDTANSSGNFCEFICKWNAPYPVSTSVTTFDDPDYVTTTTTVMTGGHQYLNPVGV
jgi:uncharacterized protein (UPF0333 family)